MKKNYLILLLSVFLQFFFFNHPAHSMQPKENNYELVDSLNKRTKKLENVYSEQEKRINILVEELKETQANYKNLKNSIDNITIAWTTITTITKIGAMVLLLGLFIEIIGATLLAGNHLVVPQKEIFSLKATRPLRDLALVDVNKEPRLDFLGTIGSLLLFIGFILQFSGTILVLALPWEIVLALFTIAIIPGVSIIYYLMGQSTEQTRQDKLQLIIQNIKRNFTPSQNKCDFCFKKMSDSEVYVWWLQEENTDQYPYLHEPYLWHIGHDECISKSGWYDDHRANTRIPRLANLFNKSVKDFINDEAFNFQIWWKKYHKHWTSRRGYESKTTAHQEEFQKIIQRIKKLTRTK